MNKEEDIKKIAESINKFCKKYNEKYLSLALVNNYVTINNDPESKTYEIWNFNRKDFEKIEEEVKE
jgi:hypothetical protein